MDYRKEANRLADALESGDTYDYGSTSVIYGWSASCDDPTSPAADLLRAMADEIERLRAEISSLRNGAHWWRYLERNDGLGFACPPAYYAKIKVKIIDAADGTLSAIVDSALTGER